MVDSLKAKVYSLNGEWEYVGDLTAMPHSVTAQPATPEDRDQLERLIATDVPQSREVAKATGKLRVSAHEDPELFLRLLAKQAERSSYFSVELEESNGPYP
jgi:hypothetical protein